MRRFVALPLLFTLTCLSLAGCGSLSPRPDPSRFFTLTAQAEVAPAAKNPGMEQLLLGVGPIRLPGYLDREELVTRINQNRFDVAQNDRWIEPLEENFSRVLAQNLSALLTIERIFRYPWPGNRRITHQVEIEILRFEADSAQEAQLAARWSVIDAGTKQPLAIKSSFLRRPSREQTREGSVDAMSEALADLSREIADTVRAIARQQKPQAGKEKSGRSE